MKRINNITYEVRAAEKITNNGETVSGDDILSGERSTEQQAKALAEKWLKRKDVLSVWILKYEDGEDDPTYQWRKYEGDKVWRGGNYWW